MLGILVSLAALSVLIMVHEYGHFLMARKSGIRVEKFSLGFGKKLFGFKKGDTEYTVCLIPLGGYVKLAGDNPEDFTGAPDEFLSKGILSRGLVIFMGPCLNYVLAFIIFWLIFVIGFPALSPRVGAVLDNFPAKAAGIQKGDLILRIDGVAVKTWEEMQKAVSEAKNDSVELSFQRREVTVTKQVLLKKDTVADIFGKKHNLKFLGVRPAEETVFLRFGFFESFVLAGERLYTLTALTLKALFHMFTGTLSVRDSVTGPLGIVYITTKAAGIGLSAFLNVVAVLSMSLGVFNLLPLPILDGGHIFLLLIEKIKGSRLNAKVNKVINDIGISFIVLAAVLVFVNDLVKFQVFDKFLKLFTR